MAQSPFQLPANAPFQHEQRVALEALLPSLKPGQGAWLSGYFAALDQLTGGGSAAVAAAPAGAPAVAAATPSEPLTILYGSESGNAEGLAFDLDKEAKKAGFKTTVVDMGDYDPEKLKDEKNVFIVVSTWGEGDPPERATGFYDFVMGESAPKLEKVNFSVCALGDTSYADFCQCGINFDKRLAELGAKRIADRVDCDVDFEEPFRAWLDKALPAMVEVTGVKEKVAEAAAQPATVSAPAMAGIPTPAAPVVEGWSKKNPFPATLTERIILNGTGSRKETLHLELDLAGSGLSYEPGDVLGVFPTNNPQVAEDLLRLAGFRGDELREVDGQHLSLVEMLANYDVTSLSKAFMKKYAPLAKHKALDRLLTDESKDQLNDWLWGRELRDLFYEFPPADSLSVDQLIGMLRNMPPRLYSIASSIKAHPDEVHLTVAAVRYTSHGRQRMGVCSTYLADRVEVGGKIPVFLHHNKNFKLPENPETPIIMVGPGTGIAPFRAFIEDRAETGATGKSWLFFGDWTFQFDFLYQLEWQNYLKSGKLTRMDVAFSRDTHEKIYVQHRMREKGRDLWAWLEEGAHFYVCGDATRMAKDVHQTLIDIAIEHGGKSPEEAEAYIERLRKDKRYQRDVY